MINEYAGMRIVVSENCVKQVSDPVKPSRHRSKRIWKKLLSRTHSEPAIFHINGMLMMHPVTYQELKRKLRENGDSV